MKRGLSPSNERGVKKSAKSLSSTPKAFEYWFLTDDRRYPTQLTLEAAGHVTNQKMRHKQKIFPCNPNLFLKAPSKNPKYLIGHKSISRLPACAKKLFVDNYQPSTFKRRGMKTICSLIQKRSLQFHGKFFQMPSEKINQLGNLRNITCSKLL